MYDVPGRIGNLYKGELGSTVSGISESLVVPTNSMDVCMSQPAAEDYGCFNTAELDKELIPARRIQYDIAVENELNRAKTQRRQFPWILILLLLPIVVAFFFR
jgi:hypothetical protein